MYVKKYIMCSIQYVTLVAVNCYVTHSSLEKCLYLYLFIIYNIFYVKVVLTVSLTADLALVFLVGKHIKT